MKKLRMGHDPRKLGMQDNTYPPFKKERQEKLLETLKDMAKNVEMPTAGSLILDAAPVPEKTVIVESRTQVLKESRDKWARRHSKLSNKKMETALDELMETLNQQNERIHYLQHQTKELASISEKQSFDINSIRMQKPKEIQTVTEKHITETVKSEVPKMVWVLIGISLLTNMYLLIAR